MAGPKRPDIVHEGVHVNAPMRRHRPEYADMCPTCSAALTRSKNIGRLLDALVEFGYSTLTRAEVAAAYDGALAGEPDGGDIIRMMVKGQMAEAGLIPEKEVQS